MDIVCRKILHDESHTVSQKDLISKDKQLINILCDANVPPSKITKIMTSIREDDKGTLLPKTIFNINEKCRRLIDLANGILPTCSDAKKTLKLLQLWVYLFFMFLLCICISNYSLSCIGKTLIIIVSCTLLAAGYFLKQKVFQIKKHAKNWSVLIF